VSDEDAKEAPAIASKFTPELEARILARVREGNDLMIACLAEGVPKWLYKEWLSAARNPDGRRAKERPKLREQLVAWLEKVDQHYALFEADSVRSLNNPPESWFDARGRLDKGHINRLTWLLERVRRQRFGLRVTIDDLRDEASKRVLDRLREGLDPSTLAVVLGVLDPEGSEGGEGGGVDGDDSLPLC